ncbi:uncharacterized protein LOC110704727 [Chenopodium quinoa]|uniref:uncharacterized protein LOC110704727 n=1 Tax=Chenopodium quinoa TaxID=63459 RepID=UPI000B77A750|nr:uncharacterized protein LOC110704727 [Chenopodium quinoa]
MTSNDQYNDFVPPPTEFHPALSVTNIKNCIPLILDRNSAKYSNWEELFEVHAHAYNVLDHISSKTPRPTGISDSLCQRLDSIVKQWIYGTISTDLLDTVLCKDCHLSSFSDVSSYCKQLKCLKDQLASVDHPNSEKVFVMRLIAGHRNTDFDIVAAILAQTEPLPSFEIARSRLLLEETRCSNDQSNSAQPFIAQQSDSASSGQSHQSLTSASNSGGGGSGGRGSGRG